MMKQFTKAQAIALYESGEWKDWTDEEIVKIQLYQEFLCVPFTKVHAALEHVLDRPVWTHEFAFLDGLIEEYEGTRPAPSFQDIIDLIPEEKRIIIGL